LWIQYYTGKFSKKKDTVNNMPQLSRLYYSAYPSNAITPILFIAAGIFSLFITVANRMNFNEKQMNRSGGTGGYLLWCENTIPLKEDLNTESGRRTLGLDEDQYKKLIFVQMKRSSGNDASCLNLNHITAPPLLGVDPTKFIENRSFSFSKASGSESSYNPWQFLKIPAENNIIYGIADQTVLDWGLKIKTRDTIILRSENGKPLKVIIAAGLKSSVFQGNILIGLENFTKYYSSVSGSSVLLVDGDKEQIDLYKSALSERLDNYGVNIEKTTDRLASFYKVTNTYLSVFAVFGALGMIVGIAGLGFILLRNYNLRRREFALMLATGFNLKRIRNILLSEQLLILFAGVTSGVISAIVATLPSINSSPDIPWFLLITMILAIILSAITALILSVRRITSDSLVSSLKSE
jgi:hypothetical protein